MRQSNKHKFRITREKLKFINIITKSVIKMNPEKYISTVNHVGMPIQHS